MTDDETMWRCIGALLLEGEMFDWQRCCSIAHPLGTHATTLLSRGFIAGAHPAIGKFCVTNKGRQFFLADHSKKED